MRQIKITVHLSNERFSNSRKIFRFSGIAILMFTIFLNTAVLANYSTNITDQFTCPNFLQVVREITGIPYPGYIYKHDVSEIIYIIANEREISCLSGIEYFTSLKGLNLDNNNLSAIDLSNLTSLTDLTISNNNLYSLDISMLNLTSLMVNNIGLVDLDLSNSTALQSLWVSYNSLAYLDISNNPYLKILYASGNKLTGLDVSTKYMLQSLSVGHNKLTGIYLPNSDSLRLLCVGYNAELSALDLSIHVNLLHLRAANAGLTKLDVSNNTALTLIDVNNNELVALDISNNHNLESLSVAYNFMYSPYQVVGWNYLYACQFRFFPQRVSPNNPNNISAVFSCANFRAYIRCRLGISDYAYIMRQYVANITRLSPAGRDITSLVGIEYFPRLNNLQAQNNPNLTALSIRDLPSLQNIVVQGSGILALELYNLQNLRHINIADNALISLNLFDLPNLTGLSISNNKLKFLDVSTVPSLRVLRAERNKLGNYVSVSPNLTTLLLADNINMTLLDVTELNYLIAIDVRGSGITSSSQIKGLPDSLIADEFEERTEPAWMRPRVVSGLAVTK